jgi:hypothetical protein
VRGIEGMTMRLACLGGFLIGAVAGTAHAWDAAGHRAVCMKAWQEMNEPARTAVSDLLDIASADAFASTCAWADDITDERPETGPWHVIHIPKEAREIDLARDCRQPASCVVDQIERHLSTVAAGAPKAARAEALKFLAHLVGDLHQPLHVAFAEDRGGEDITITFLGRKTNMQALWDSVLLAAPDPPSRGYTPFLQQMTDRYNRERWTVGGPRDWALETLWIMRAPPTGYVGNPGGLAFDEIYVKQNYLVAVDQIDKAGVRLGAMLNEAFK